MIASVFCYVRRWYFHTMDKQTTKLYIICIVVQFHFKINFSLLIYQLNIDNNNKNIANGRNRKQEGRGGPISLTCDDEQHVDQR